MPDSRRNFHRPHRMLRHPSPQEEQELELDLGLLGSVRECCSDLLPLERQLVSRIRAMSVAQQGLALDIIRHYLEGHTQLPRQQHVMDIDISLQNLLESLCLEPKQATNKTLLFRLFGLILCECTDMALVKRYLTCLLELSPQDSSQQEDIALAVGLASTKHLEEVWALLEQLCSTWFLRWRNLSPEAQDDVLKANFLSAAVLLTSVLRRDYGVQRYKFTQIPEFIQCLLWILQEEPNFLATLSRQKIILVIVGLSNLRPSLQPWVKSRVLEVCLRSVYMLPPTKELFRSLPSLDPSPDIDGLYKKTVHALDLLLQSFLSENPSMNEVCFLLQHMEHWLQSVESHERQRAVQSTLLLLQYAEDILKSTEEATPSMLGHQLGLLILLWWDTDEETQNPARQCVYLLLKLSMQQKGEMVDLSQSKVKCFKFRTSGKGEVELQHLVKAFNKALSVAQHTQLVLVLLHSLSCCGLLQCQLTSKFLLMVFEGPSIKPEQINEVLRSLFQELPRIHCSKAQEIMLKAMIALGTQHTPEVVEVLLFLCHPSEKQILTLWMALAANWKLARKVMTLLYTKLKQRPALENIQPSHQVQLISILALGTIYELLYIQEYRTTVRWAFAGILLGLLTQLHYLFELGMVKGFLDFQEDTLDSKPLGPCRTCLEAMKGLFWTTRYWEVFAHVKMLRGWELFERLETYTEGVTVLARAMALYDCEVGAVLGQAIISLKSCEERDNIVAILIITEFLNSPEVPKHVSQKAMDNLLSLGLNSPNWLVRAMSLKGLSSIMMNAQKCGRVAGSETVASPETQSSILENGDLLNSLLQPEPQDLLGLIAILSDILHRLGLQGIGPISLQLAQHLLQLFEHEKAKVRASAIFLFGDVIYSGGRKFQQPLKKVAFQALVPLLFHLADAYKEVVMRTKITFFRCTILLNWEFRKELFSKLAWGRGVEVEYDIFTIMMESNSGSHHQFFMQALTYLGSPCRNLKLAAMKFIGAMLQDYFLDLCFHLKKSDIKILKKCELGQQTKGEPLPNPPSVPLAEDFGALLEDRDDICRRFYLNFSEDIMDLSQYAF
nr:maestro heat-like repeat family member 5 [Cavia porcellus]